MDLNLQIISLLFSYFFGILFSFLLNLNYKIIYQKNKLYRIITTLLFVLLCTLVYFIVLKKINEGIIHPYFFLMIILGFFTVNSKLRPLRFVFSKLKCYNVNNKGGKYDKEKENELKNKT